MGLFQARMGSARCTLHAQQEKKVTWRQARVRRRSNNLGLWLRTVCCKNAWPQDDSAAVSGPAFLDLSVLETAHAREKTQVSAAAQQGKPERWSSATGRCFLLALPFTPFKIPFLLRSTVTVGASQCQKRELTGKLSSINRSPDTQSRDPINSMLL